jgi:hypothetical protein
VSWLLSLSGISFEIPGQFDDPNATAANICKKKLKKFLFSNDKIV